MVHIGVLILVQSAPIYIKDRIDRYQNWGLVPGDVTGDNLPWEEVERRPIRLYVRRAAAQI